MNANPEVMQAPVLSSTRPIPPGQATPVRGGEGARDRDVPSPLAVRVSEDPMRRTDRYRLVMPWSSRV